MKQVCSVLALVGLFGLLLAPAARAESELRPFPGALASNFGVIGIRAHAVAGTLQVDKVRWQSPAADAGLQVGDQLLGAAGIRLVNANQLSLLVQSIEPGDSLSMHVVRSGSRFDLPCAVTDRRHLYGLMMEQEFESDPPLSSARPSCSLRTVGNSENRTERTEAEALIEHLHVSNIADSLRRALTVELSRYGIDGRLWAVELALSQPLLAPAVAYSASSAFVAGSSLQQFLLAAAAQLDLSVPGYEPDRIRGAGLMALVEPGFRSASADVGRAFARLSQDEQDQLHRGVEPLLQRFHESFYLDEGSDGETARHMQTLRLAKRVDVARLFQAAAAVSHFAEAEFRQHLLAEAQKLRDAGLRAEIVQPPAGFQGRFLHAELTDWGWFVVGDTSANVYTTPAALIIDLGGDDRYIDLPTSTAPPVTVILDLAGNDRYMGSRTGSQGSAALGVSLLVDVSGNDTYSGSLLTQGAAFCGVGVLQDEAGDDTYLAEHTAQGIGFFGAGLLVDLAGRDLCRIGQYGQGFGGAGGFGLLFDGHGSDRYLADLQVPSSYGTPGVFNGWAQGLGMGFRGFTAGGIGLLLSAGNEDDFYQAGDFSQGTGYFLGLGILADEGGADMYRGARYAQGSAAHAAVGVLLDQHGRDQYFSSTGASQGAAWDAAVAVLSDLQGNDRYISGPLSQGAAAMNGVGWLYDRAGDDIYQCASGQGDGGSTEYWGGRGALNLGLLIDGAGVDDYSRPDRQDRSRMRDSQVGLFFDR